MYSFGSGVLIGTRTDIINATPVNFGLVQEVTIEESASVKELYGQFQHPIAIGARHDQDDGQGQGGADLRPGARQPVLRGRAGSGPTRHRLCRSRRPCRPRRPTPSRRPTPRRSPTTRGVVYAATGLPLIKVAATPAPGQYALAAGVYTFNAADAGKAVLVSYTYAMAASGQKFTVTNQLLGATPTFAAQFFTTFQGQGVSLKLNNCTSSKLSFQTKMEDFVLPEFDFSCFADASGTVMTWSFAEAS